MKLIDKAAVVAEIERRKKELIELSNDFENRWACGSLDNILSFLDTLEVKEVDLELGLKSQKHETKIITRPFNEVFNQEEIDAVDKKILESQEKERKRLEKLWAKDKDFPMNN